MTELAFPLPEIGEASLSADPRTLEALINIKAWAAGQIDSTNLKALGVTLADLAAESVSEAKLTKAVAELLNAKTAGLATKAHTTTESTLKTGEVAEFTGGSSLAAKMPAVAPANQYLTVCNFLNTEANTVTLKGEGAKFYGGFVKAANTLILLQQQWVTLFSDGTQWQIVAGESKREQVYSGEAVVSKAEWEAGVEPSAIRSALVTVIVVSTAEKRCAYTAKVGGKTAGVMFIPPMPATNSTSSLTFEVPPGVKWTLSSVENISGATESHILR